MSTVEFSLPAILDDAASILRVRGWCRGDFCDDETAPDSPVCLLGAINAASGAAPWDIPGARARGAERAYLAVLETVDLLPADEETATFAATEDVVSLLAEWADAPGRTIADVTRVLTQAARAA